MPYNPRLWRNQAHIQEPVAVRTAVRPLIAVFGLALVSGCSAPHTDAAAAAATSTAPAPPGRTPLPSNAALSARAKTFELDTPYVPPPGDPLEHNTSGFAKTMCSAVFITGLDPDFAAENVGYFTGPYEERKKVSTPVVDRAKKEVRITLPNGVTRPRAISASQGCVTLPDRPGRRVLQAGRGGAPAARRRRRTPWPMGDVLPADPLPAGHRRGQGQARGRRRIRAGRGDDRGVRGDATTAA